MIYFIIYERRAIQGYNGTSIYMVALKNSQTEFGRFARYVHNSHGSPVHNAQ